jgi:hypothetical protein
MGATTRVVLQPARSRATLSTAQPRQRFGETGERGQPDEQIVGCERDTAGQRLRSSEASPGGAPELKLRDPPGRSVQFLSSRLAVGKRHIVRRTL